MLDEDESKRLRIFQRYERQELQLIIERCNEVAFDYVCLPSLRSDKDLCFGSKTPRNINFYIGDKTVNSFSRKCLKENFPDPTIPETTKAQEEETTAEVTEVKFTYPFSSKVQRFQDITIDSSGIYRRKKKTREAPVVVKKIFSAFGSSRQRKFLCERNPTESSAPGVGTYNFAKDKKTCIRHSFNGDVTVEPAFDIVCSPINLDDKCEMCEEKPRNVYWKSRKTQTVLCRPCFNSKLKEIHERTRIVEKLRLLKQVERDLEKKRYCDFYHEHNKTSAAVRLLPSKVFHQRIQKENFLNTLFHY